MASASHPPAPHLSAVAAATAGGRRAELALAGDLDLGTVREFEERLDDPLLRRADEWVVDLSGVTRLDLSCAYALLRAATQRPAIARLTVRGAGRTAQRTLRHAGLDTIALIEE
ncbi:STAS domain-containing protein [Streptomyces sp. NPDC005526]|uniref:STAS domain-containing protein n=1 Tax=Streptomyces sp. NPDC005526 TaxID=3156885 RepID=UPI0033AE41D2